MAPPPAPEPLENASTVDSGSPAASRGWEGEGGAHSNEELSTGELLEQLRQDRLWLLRQIDSGRWPQWRLDLAALERELGQLLEQAAERCGEA
jgi:hypothetical protein